MKFLEPMSEHTTFKIGGPCDIWAVPESAKELSEVTALCRRDGLKMLMVGMGSNLLVRDEGFEGAAISLDAPAFKGISRDKDTVTAGAGVSIAGLLRFLRREGLAGLEFLAGIPATVGGAVAMNAGGGRRRIKDYVERTETLKEDEGIILSAAFRLKISAKNDIASRMKDFLSRKAQTQDLKNPSAGCVFKNPRGAFAGQLIEKSGLKGARIGAAAVSDVHANFIVNLGGARCDDVLKLMDVVSSKVKKDHGVSLEPEVQVVG